MIIFTSCLSYFDSPVSSFINVLSVVLELKSEEDWEKLNYFENFNVSTDSVKDTVPRVNYNEITRREFIEKYERPRIPVVITHGLDHWRATRKWTIQVMPNYTNLFHFLKNVKSGVSCWWCSG